MFRFSPPLTFQLGRGELLAWHQGDVTLRVVAGTVWITQQGDPDDHFLMPGQAFALRRGAAALIGAEQDAWLRVETAPRGPAWQGALARLLIRRLTGRATPTATVAG